MKTYLAEPLYVHSVDWFIGRLIDAPDFVEAVMELEYAFYEGEKMTPTMAAFLVLGRKAGLISPDLRADPNGQYHYVGRDNCTCHRGNFNLLRTNTDGDYRMLDSHARGVYHVANICRLDPEVVFMALDVIEPSLSFK